MTQKFTPADARDVPQYIDPNCPECNAALVLYDKFYGFVDDQEESEEIGTSIWYDEWVCPVCQDGIHLDFCMETNLV